VPDDDLILKKADGLVRDVRRLIAASPADRSALRHSLGRTPDQVTLDVHRIVVAHLPDEQADDATERAFYAVAAYMAAQSRDARNEEHADAAGADDTGRRPNLGQSLARAVHGRGLNETSIEPRLQLLARQEVEGLHRQLPRLVLYLRGKRVLIDWAVLIRDLARWGRQPKQVAKEWMQSYYRTSERLNAEKKRHEAAAAAGGSEEQ
jgi:CRISPR system Cascade subunit CasB